MIRQLRPDDVGACAELLARLPEWFGLADANAAYVDSLHELPAFVAVEDRQIVGFIAVLEHDEQSAEVTVMAVDPSRHRQGIGQRLLAAAEQRCVDRDVRWLHVKTRGPATFDEDYERTRRFYRAMGFDPLYESLTEWGPDNAALVLVKHLGCRRSP